MNGSDKELIKLIARLVIAEMIENQDVTIPIGISNRHIHVSRSDLDTLFGEGFELTRMKDLRQPGQYAAEETVTLKGPKGEFRNVRILGPVRDETQIEISLSDGFRLGINPPVRESGKLNDSASVEIIGPRGSITKTGAIAALRHIHMTPEIAAKLNVADKDMVDVKVPGVREAVLGNVLVRVSDKYALEMHVDLDEANACGLKNGDSVKIVKKG